MLTWGGGGKGAAHTASFLGVTCRCSQGKGTGSGRGGTQRFPGKEDALREKSGRCHLGEQETWGSTSELQSPSLPQWGDSEQKATRSPLSGPGRLASPVLCLFRELHPSLLSEGSLASSEEIPDPTATLRYAQYAASLKSVRENVTSTTTG